MRFALVTGGTKGIGKAIGVALLEQEYSVILNYSQDDFTAQETLLELTQKYPNRIFLLKQDLSMVVDLKNFKSKVLNITQYLHVLVLNAGATDRSGFLDVTVDNWEKVFHTNLTVPFFLIQSFAESIVKGGSIIVTGSLMGIQPHSISIAYGTSKAAVHAMVRNMVKILAPLHIRINAIAPGFINTEWQESKPEDIKRSIEKKISLKQFGSTESVADTCIFLATNSYINGEIIVVDGGYNFE